MGKKKFVLIAFNSAYMLAQSPLCVLASPCALAHSVSPLSTSHLHSQLSLKARVTQVTILYNVILYLYCDTYFYFWISTCECHIQTLTWLYYFSCDHDSWSEPMISVLFRKWQQTPCSSTITHYFAANWFFLPLITVWCVCFSSGLICTPYLTCWECCQFSCWKNVYQYFSCFFLLWNLSLWPKLMENNEFKWL